MEGHGYLHSGHGAGDGLVFATHEAPVPLREAFDVSTHQCRSQCREFSGEAAHVKCVCDIRG